MRKLLLVAGLLACMGLIFGSAAQAGWFDLGKSLEGSVVDISENLITVSPVDQPELEAMDFEINETTTFENAASADDLASGDEVKIKYSEEEGRMIATHITKKELPEG